MKVILTKELQGRGGEGDVVEVARGFAVNYLLPRGLAIQATAGNLKQLEQRMHNIKTREAQRVTEASGFSAQLHEKSVTIEVKVGEEGRLFGSVTNAMVAEAIAEQLGVEVDRRKVEVTTHVKEVGSYTADVAVYRDIKAVVTVNVVAEGGAVEAPVEAPVEVPVEVEAEAEVADEAAEAVAEEETTEE